MAIANSTGVLDTTIGYVIPVNVGTWGDLGNTAWSSWSSWLNQPADPLVWLTDAVDLGTNTYFNMTTTAVVNGNLTYNIHASTTGAFAGEEITTTIISGNRGEVQGNLDAFYGRYVMIQANIAGTGGLPSLQQLTFTTQNTNYTLTLDDLDSSQLTANGTGRIIPLGRTVGAVKNMQITPRLGSGGSVYVDTGYIDTDYFESSLSRPVFPTVVSKNRNTPTVQFNNTADEIVDTVFDAHITVLPEQARLDDNLIVR
jgi:hypothetical protein